MTDLDRALDAYLHVIAEEGWPAATLARVAEVAGLTPADVLASAGDQWQALAQALGRADRQAIAAVVPDPDASPRDRLFDLIMARFDAARPFRTAGVRLRDAALYRPLLAAVLLSLAARTSARLLSAAGIETPGIGGVARVNALTLIIGDVARTFITDDDPDLGPTMRALDERLGQAERWMARLCSGQSMDNAEAASAL